MFPPPIVPLPLVADLSADRQAEAGLPTGSPFQYVFLFCTSSTDDFGYITKRNPRDRVKRYNNVRGRPCGLGSFHCDLPIRFDLDLREASGLHGGSGFGSTISNSCSLSRLIIFKASASGIRAYDPRWYLRFWAREMPLRMGCHCAKGLTHIQHRFRAITNPFPHLHLKGKE
jgi:hypothetical protein